MFFIELDNILKRFYGTFIEFFQKPGNADVPEVPDLRRIWKSEELQEGDLAISLTGDWHNSLLAIDCQG